MRFSPWQTGVLLLLVVSTLALLGGCAGKSGTPDTTAKPRKTELSKDDFQVRRGVQKELRAILRRVEASKSPERDGHLLSAAEILREARQWQGAGNILNQIRPDSLSSEQTSRFSALRMEWLFRTGTARDALVFMSETTINPEDLGEDGEVRLASLRAEIYSANQQHLASARERMLIHDLLNREGQAANTERLWSSLMELPTRVLDQQARDATTYDLRGWLSLAGLARRYQDDIRQLWEQFQDWQEAWEDHVAGGMPPAALASLADSILNEPEQIALLLPFSGPLAPYGEAIRDGFMAAHFSQADSQIEFRLYDSGAGDPAALLHQAIEEGAEFVIGPLDKQRAAAIAEVDRRGVPVLALNHVDVRGGDHFYQLGLTPADEVRQLVDVAIEQGHKRALLIYPADQWGERNARLFRSFAESQNLEIAGDGAFSQTDDYRPYVSRLLGVAASEARAAQLRRVTGTPFEFSPRRRQDLDLVVLFATPNQARGINPALAYLYAEDLPIYSISHINPGKLTEIQYLDLNGVYFCDLPFKLLEDNPLRRQINQTWSNSEGQLAAFYALGIDAFHLFPRISQMAGSTGYRHYGATGTLSVDEDGQVRRKLIWAQVKSGRIQVGVSGEEAERSDEGSWPGEV